VIKSLQRRLGKLEARLLDSSGLVPHSPRWLEYWSHWFDDYTRDPSSRPGELITIEAARAVMASIPDNDYTAYQATHAV
jgi:hypothetical protein